MSDDTKRSTPPVTSAKRVEVVDDVTLRDVDLSKALNSGALGLSQAQIVALSANQPAGFSTQQLKLLLSDPPPSITAHHIACLQANLPAGLTLAHVADLMAMVPVK